MCYRCKGKTMTNSILDLIAEADKAKAERAAAYPEVASCVEAMVQIRLRLLEMGWQSAEYAPKDGSKFWAIPAGFTGPSECSWWGGSFFVASEHDWQPTTTILVWRKTLD